MDADTMATADISDIFGIDASFAAASDPCVQMMFNSGVMLLRPSGPVFNDLQELASTVGSFDAGDQGVLNLYFGKDWQPAAVLDGGR
eukprot:scaffold398251_cov29-Prasinocladus_malaysianus.AAC.1